MDASDPSSKPIATHITLDGALHSKPFAYEGLPAIDRVKPSNPSSTTGGGEPSRLNVALSRLKQGFDTPWSASSIASI